MNGITQLRTATYLPIGVDVGEAGLRLVQLAESEDGLSVHRAAVWTSGFGRTGTLNQELIAERFSQFAQQTGFVGRRAIACLSLPSIETHPLELPATDGRVAHDELAKAAAWQIQRLTTLDNTGLQTALWSLPESKRSKTTHVGVAAPREQVERRLAVCAAAGLNCIQVDVASCALANLAWRLLGRPPEQVWGVLDVGHRYTRLAICVDEVPVMVRSFEMGGSVWTKQISEALQLSEDAAERNKKEFGLSAKAQSQGGSGQELSAMILGILRDDLQRLSLEAERSYEYVLQCYPTRTPGDLVMVGGGSLLEGLGEYLEERLGVAVHPLSTCPSSSTRELACGLPENGDLETCALASALSLQGAVG